ncbi:MAG: nitroreductase [Micrococcales bacterium]
MSKYPDFSAFLASRRTTRDFASTPVDAKLIESLINDGLTAPSWSNTRPFMIAVATGEQRDRISADMLSRWWVLAGARSGGLIQKIRFAFTPKAWPISDYDMLNAYPKELLPRSRRVGKELYSLLGVARGDKKARDEHWALNYKFFNAPTVLFVFIHKKLDVFAANDAGLFAENLMLSAHAQGLGTCAQGAVGLWRSAVRKEFKVPKGYKLVYGIAIGYATDEKVNTFQANRIAAQEVIISSAE